MKRQTIRVACLLAASLGLAGCVTTPAPGESGTTAASDPAAARKPLSLPQEVERLSRVTADLTESDGANRARLTEISQRLALLERDVSQIRGELETVLHERATAAAAPPPVTAAPPPQPAAPIYTPPPPVTPQPPVAPQAPVTPPQPSNPPSAQAAYQAAYQYMTAFQYDQALQSFTRFLEWYPDDPLSDNSQYWVGEVHYVNQRYAEALVAFNQVLIRWPGGDKVPDALLKIGFCFHALGDIENAKRSLGRLIKEFPESHVIPHAQQRLKRIEEEARQSGR